MNFSLEFKLFILGSFSLTWNNIEYLGRSSTTYKNDPPLKSTKKPPKAPRAIPNPLNLNNAFDEEAVPIDSNISNVKQVSPEKSDTKIRKNADLSIHNTEKHSKKRMSVNNGKKMIQSQPLLIARKSSGSKLIFKARSKPRDRKVNMIPIEMESFSSEESEDENSSGCDMDKFRAPIETLDQFLALFGAQVESQSEESLLISIINKSASVTIPRSIFNGLCKRWNNFDKIDFQPLSEFIIDTIESKDNKSESIQEFNNKAPILNNSNIWVFIRFRYKNRKLENCRWYDHWS